MSDTTAEAPTIRPFTMLAGAGPACEGDECLPVTDAAAARAGI